MQLPPSIIKESWVYESNLIWNCCIFDAVTFTILEMYSNLNNKQRLTNEQTLTMPNFVYRNNPKKNSQSCRPEILKKLLLCSEKNCILEKSFNFLKPTKILIHLCILLLHYCSSMSEMLHVFIVVYMPNKNHYIYKRYTI